MRKLFAILCIALATVSCGGSEKPKQTTFVWGRSSDASHLDPAVVTDGESVLVTTNLFETLITFRPGTTELVPGLAESWETSEDRLIWTFKLRKGVTFHDGSAFDADAVVFSFERQMHADHPARRASDQFSYFADNFKALEKVEAVDPHTVRFTLSRPYAPFLSALGLFSAAIVSPTAWKSEGKDADGRYKYAFSTNPVGTGPYVFSKWEKDVHIILKANPNYWGGKPAVDRLIFKPTLNPQTRLQELESGTIHGMDNPDLADLPSARKNKDLQVLEQPGLNVGYLAMNTLKKPFDDVRVRQAVAWTIDKKRLIESAYEGRAEPAVTMCPRGMWGHANLPDRKPDLDRARKLLADAGFPDGFETEIWYGTAQRTYMPRPGDVAIQIQQDLKKIGIRASLKRVEWSAYIPATKRGDHPMALLGWMADIGDPDNFLYVLLDKENARVGDANNISFYRDEEAHRLLSAAQQTYDMDERARLYREAQKKVFEDCPVVPLVQVSDYRILRANVRGYRIWPVGGEYFHKISFAGPNAK